MGYAKENDVEQYWKEMMVNVIAPISNEMAKNYISTYVLGLPKSY